MLVRQRLEKGVFKCITLITEEEVTLSNNRTNTATCQHVREDGSRCQAIANRNTGLCAVHSGFKPRLNTSIDPTISFAHAKIYLYRIARLVKEGKLTPQVGQCINSIMTNVIKIHEIEEIQRYLDQQKTDASKQQLKEGDLPPEFDDIED